jgi:2-iminobutanoate/2-iminopropanoate deaminase
MSRQVIKAPMWSSPMFSHAVRASNLVFTAGQVAIDPDTGQAVPGNISVQTRRVLDNLVLILQAAGTTLDNTVKATVYLRNWDDFDAFNAVYVTYFPQDPPGRTTTQAGRLGAEFLVEIELIAAVPEA